MTWAKGAMCGGPAQVAAANEEGDAEINAEERAKRERQEQRLQTMTSFVVVMGLVEVCCRIKSLSEQTRLVMLANHPLDEDDALILSSVFFTSQHDTIPRAPRAS